jgi:hypothetical protein
MSDRQRQLILSKGNEKFIYRYDQGNEDELIDTLVSQAKDQRIDFDWFDAAILSFKLTQSLICQADELLKADKRKEVESNNI